MDPGGKLLPARPRGLWMGANLETALQRGLRARHGSMKLGLDDLVSRVVSSGWAAWTGETDRRKRPMIQLARPFAEALNALDALLRLDGVDVPQEHLDFSEVIKRLDE